jgi:hypothetical protein
MTEVPGEDGGGSSFVTLQVTSTSDVKSCKKKPRRYAHDVLDIQDPLRLRGLWRRTHRCDDHVMFLVLQVLFLVPNFAGVVDRREAVHLLSLAIELNREQASVRTGPEFQVYRRSCVRVRTMR